jgi:amino acid adenylation domain-containing protein/non-ribosomal peptide synthase protein (TIGR01720 family)
VSDARQTLERLRRLGARLTVAAGRLQVRAARDALTPELREALALHKQEILVLLEGEAAATRAPELRAVPRSEDEPLSPAQERLWFLQQLAPANSSYNLGSAFRLRGPLDVEALRTAFTRLAERHETLRTNFPDRDGVPVQRVGPPGPVPIAVTDLSGLPEAERVAAARRLVEEQRRRPFRLAEGSPARVALLRLAADDHVLLVVLHHVVADGWSLAVLQSELGALHDAARAGREAGLPPLPVQYADYARWQRELLQGERLDGLLGFWKEQLAHAAPLELPTDHPRPRQQTFAGARATVTLPASLVRALEETGRAAGASLFMTLLAGFQVLLQRYAAQDDIVIGVPAATRDRTELEGLVGCFTNMLALRTDLGGDPTFTELLLRTRRTSLQAFEHQDLPFERLVRELVGERDPSRNPIFQVFFALQNMPAAPLRLAGLEVETFEYEFGATDLDLDVYVEPAADGLRVTLLYNTDLFEAVTVQGLASAYRVLLEGLAREPGRRLAEFALLAQDAADRGAAILRGPVVPATDGDCVHALVAAQARRSPDAVAVSCAGTSLTYAQLEARAERLARRLRRLGVRAGVPVGLALERGLDLPVALLGILQAGGAYVPLDPSHPVERLAFALADTGTRVLVTQSRLAGRLPAFEGARVLLDAGWPEIAEAPEAPLDDPSLAACPGSVAYVIHTSGSTGRPKGVRVPHSAVVNFLRSMAREPGLAPHDVLLAVTTLAFDIAGLELFLPLTVGARVEIAPRDVASDGHRLRELLASCGATVMQATPATWQMLLHAGWEGDRRLRLLCGGEELPRPLADALLRLGGELWNMYGPTETTIWSSVLRVQAGAGPVPIGPPIDNTWFALLDSRLRPVPRGAPGELFIGGAGVALGYLDRPELTAERFLDSPWPDRLPGRVYRTGDLVRLDARGQLAFLGRGDEQVKLRGFRIELGEIESVLAAQPGVRLAAALVHGAAPDERRLAAFFVPRAGLRPAVADLREALRARLPGYMVPASLVELEELPLTPAGKLDRRRLAALVPAQGGGQARVAPRGPLEEGVAGIFRELLRVDHAGAHDDFFALGGHSLLATRLVSRIRATFAVELPLGAVFAAPTVAGVARSIAELRGQGRAAAAGPIPRVPRTGDLPLSFAQHRLWLLDQMGAGAGYHMRLELALTGPLDVAALGRALDALVARHETLRTRFPVVGGQPRQLIEPAGHVPLALHDRTQLPVGQLPGALRDHAAQDARRPFDLAQGPLFRAAVLRLAGNEAVLVLSFHHIVADGWSYELLAREVAALYHGCVTGAPPDVPPLPVQYADFAAWQREWLAGGALEKQLQFWKRQLAGGVEALQLPTDRPRPPVQSFAGAAQRLVLGRELRDALAALAREHDATLAMVCLAAFQALLARYSGQPVVVVGSPIANRTLAELEGLVGFFVNSLVLRADLSGDPEFRELLRQVRASSLAAYDHQDLPFERLVEELAPERDPSRTPLFQVVFAMHLRDELELGGPGQLRVRMLAPEVSVTRFDLELHLFEGPEGLEATLVHSTALFDPATIARLAGHYRNLLQGVVADPSTRVSALPLLSEDERRAELVGWNETDVAVPGPGVLHELVEAQARVRPDATAVVFHERSLSYAELNARANQVARALRALGARRDTLVGLCVRRGEHLVVGLLGILKSGAAYVPLDPAYPSARLAFMLEDAGIELLVTQQDLLDGLPTHRARVLCLDRDRAQLEAQAADDPGFGAGPDDLAYAIFTSGSTGQPKAALLRHRGLCNVSHEQARAFGAGPGTRVLQFSSLSFDASTFDLVMALPKGGTLVLGEREELLPGPDLLEFLRRHAIELVTLPPTALAALPPGDLPALRTIAVAGEACPAELVQRWAPGRRFFNLYGPTEATIWSTTAELRPGDVPTIGRPIGNTQVLLLDAHGQPAPVGVPGEIHIGGVGLARGYLNRPALDAERFIAHPFRPGERLYRTGDLGRRRPDGRLEFVGRSDSQVKLRGYRIELGEVEAALDRHPAVRQSLAMVREDVPGDRRLVAYVVPAPAAAGERGEWESKHVDGWRDLYEGSYADAPEPEDRTFNTSSWNSSYTGAALPAAEMREWLDRTVEAILETRPGRVLELGCGLGLLLFRIAPQCGVYVGTDFSQAALAYVQRNLGPLAPRVRLERRAAHDLAGLPEGRFDTIVLNSVVQYFPGVEYLLRVLEGASRLLAPGGRVFVGDVRSLPLLRAFHASVLLARPHAGEDAAHLRQRVHQQMNQDQELVVSPAFFCALRERLPRLRRVGIEPKRGRYDNELSRFRYDVVLAFDGDAAAPEPRWLDWGRDVADLDALRRALAGGREPTLGVRGIPNRRTLPHVLAAARLFGEDPPAAPADGVDPDDLRALARELPCACAVSWAEGRPDGSFDVVFRRHGDGQPWYAPLAADAPPRARPWAEYANRPLRGRLLRELVPDLRRHVAASLPEHMVPSAFVVLDAFPVTPNGKLDRRALPAPDSLRLELAQQFEAPREGAERDLAAVWARVLNLERVGARDNFFELGGDSILAIHVVAAARETGWHVRARDLFEHPTVAALALVARRAPAGRAEQGLVTGPVRLSPIQRWLLEQDLTNPQHFNQTLLLAAPERHEPAALQAALLRVVGQHDALRLRFRRGPSGWEQDVGPMPAAVPLEVHDLSALPEDERRRRIEAVGSRLQSGLDLGSGLLLAAALFRAPAGQPDALLLTIHHLGVDTVSWSPLLADLQRALGPGVAGAPVPLPPKTSSFAAWSESLTVAAATPEIARQARHWLQLPWSDVQPLPVDRPGGANTAGAERALEVALDAGPTRALLHDVSAAFGTDIQAALLTALARAVRDWTGRDHVLLDLEGHGREELAEDLDVSRTVGWFTTIHPVLLTLERGADPTATLMAVHAQLAACPGHGRPFGLARFLSPDSELAGSLAALPRAGILFNYLGQLDRALGVDAGFARLLHPVGPSRSARGRRVHLLEVNAAVQDGRLRARWAFGGELHDERTVAGVAQRFLTELEALVAACGGAGGRPRPVALGLTEFGWSPEDIEDILSDIGERG